SVHERQLAWPERGVDGPAHPHRPIAHQRDEERILVRRYLEASAGPLELLRARPDPVVANHIGVIGSIARRRIDHHPHRAALDHGLAHNLGRVAAGERDLAADVLALVIAIPGARAHLDELAYKIAPLRVRGDAHGHIAVAAEAERLEVRLAARRLHP